MSIGMYNLDSSDGTTAKFAVGTETEVKGAKYKYLLAAGAIEQYAACTVTNTNTIVEGTTAISGVKPTLVAIPQFEVASGEYCWAPVGPFTLREDGETTFKVKAAASAATSVKMYTTTTAGVVDDSATDLIVGLTLTETITDARAANCIAITRLATNCPD